MKTPKPHIQHTEPETLSQCPHSLQSLNKFAFAFNSIPGLNYFISGDKNPNSLVVVPYVFVAISNCMFYYILKTLLLMYNLYSKVLTS